MPKYYTPKAAIRFANQDAVAFKSLAMKVESVVQCASDHGLKDVYYSGVIRFNRGNKWRYTVVWLYGDSVGENQDFVQPAIADVSCSDFWENSRVANPSLNTPIRLIGSNFVPNLDINVDDVDTLPPPTLIDRNNVSFRLYYPWAHEQANVPIEVIKLTSFGADYRWSDLNYSLSFEHRPTVSAISRTGTYVDGGTAVILTGTYFKQDSNISFASGAFTGWSNNCTFQSPTTIGFFSPAVPATGVYALHVRSPSELLSQEVRNVTVSYHRPEIHALLPFNTGTIAGSTPIIVQGNYFLTGAFVEFGGVPVLSTTRVSYSDGRINPTLIYVTTPPHAVGSVNVIVTNPEDGQQSAPYAYQYVIPVPTISDANFSGTTILTRKTGSAGSILYITGTNFTGSDAGMAISSLTLYSGTYTEAFTNVTYVIPTPLELQFTVPYPNNLVTGSRYGVSVSNSAGMASLDNAFEYQDLPVILSISPSSGTVAGGQFVLINGRPFYVGSTQVKFSGVLGATPTVYSTTQMSVITPPILNLNGGPVDVAVQNFGALEGTRPNAYEYVPFPTASYVQTAAGNLGRVPAETVSSVTLYGSRFLAGVPTALGTTVELSTNPGYTVITGLNDPNSVIFSVQPHAAGFAAITPTNRGIAVGATLYDAIEYVNTPTLSSISPSAAVYTGGTIIGVTGTNFINTTDTIVYVGTMPVTPIAVPATNRLSFTVPGSLAANTYNVTVRNRACTTSNALSLQLISQPTITSLSVTQGTNAGGTPVIVNGTGFLPGMTANFYGSMFGGGGNQPLTISYISPTQFSFSTPGTLALARGYAVLNISVLGLTAARSNAFLYEQQPLISSLSPTTALIAGTTLVTVNGSGFINGITTIDVDNVIVASSFVNSGRLTFTAPTHAVGGCTVKASNTFLNASIGTLTYASLPPPEIYAIQVGAVWCSTLDQAKWSIAGGAIHGGDKLLGVNFTAGDVITVIPYDGGATMFPAVTYVSPNELDFIMPAYANSTQGYLYVSNANGSSNYGIFRWLRTPTVTFLTPDMGWYNSDTYVTMYGTNFVAGQTYVSTDAGFVNRYPATVVGTTQLSFMLSSVGNTSTDYQTKNLWVANSTSQGGEASVYTGLYKTLNPPAATLINPNMALTNGTTYIDTYRSFTMPGVPVHSFQFDPLTSVWTDLGLTNQAGTLSSDRRLAPAHAAGLSYRAFGYTANNGAQIIGNGLSFTYYVASPLTVTAVGNYSAQSIPKTPGFMGNVLVVTSPYVYATPAGGIPPYTAFLEYVSDVGTGGTINIQHGLVGGTYNARGYESIYYSDSDVYNNCTRRWKVTDSIGQIAYSPNVSVSWEIYQVIVDPCVVPATPILMVGNVTKRAGDIQIGDSVLTYPETMDTTELVEAKVTYAGSHQNRTVRVVLKDGRSLLCSFNHRVATNDGWLEAEKLRSGQTIKGQVPGVVTDVIENGVQEVIKLTIAGAKTYISNGLLSHNAKIYP